MKRSKNIDFKKPESNRWVVRGATYTAFFAGIFMLKGCDSQDGFIYRSAQDCSLDNPGFGNDCQTAYQRALSEWKSSAPRYNSLADCEYDFGARQCEHYAPYFIPLMAGFMLGENHKTEQDYDLDYYHSVPLGSSRRTHSPAYNRWVSAQGDLFGNYDKHRVKVGSSTFKGSKGGARVMGRGGFGRTVSSRSSGG